MRVPSIPDQNTCSIGKGEISDKFIELMSAIDERDLELVVKGLIEMQRALAYVAARFNLPISELIKAAAKEPVSSKQVCRILLELGA